MGESKGSATGQELREAAGARTQRAAQPTGRTGHGILAELGSHSEEEQDLTYKRPLRGAGQKQEG